MQRRYDAIIVGSGFGGGVAACRLAEAGWKVCVLERGREFPEFEAPGDLLDAPRLLWRPRLNPRGLLDVRNYRRLWVLCAAGVGGGSLVYANVLLRAKPDVFTRGWPSDINSSELAPYYDCVEQMLQPRTIPPPGLPRAQAFAALAARAGQTSQLAPLAVHFGEDRVRFGQRQQGCDNNSLCDVGCPRHAKNSIDLTYLAQARIKGAEVRPMHDVLDLSPPAREGDPWKVGFRELGTRRWRTPRGWVEAPVVVLAAGATGSTRLLLQNRRRLPGLSSRLGYRFGGNGDALAAAFEPRHSAVNNANTPDAPTITSWIDRWEEQRFIVQDGGLPRGLVGLLDIIDTLGNQRNVQSLRLLWKRMATYLGLSDRGVSHHAVARRPLSTHRCSFNGHSIEDALVFLMVGDEEPNKRILLNWLGRLDIVEAWKSPANGQLFRTMKYEACLLADKAQARDTWLPIGDFGPLGKFITVHPLGGCTMADSPDDGVVDSFGRVHGYEQERLYVLDGSILPTAAGVNPSMTIAAIAERGVAQMIADAQPA